MPPKHHTVRLATLCALLTFAFSAFPSIVEAQYFRFGKNKVHYEDRTWFYLQSQHFSVFYHDGSESLARFTIGAAEESYGQVARLFNFRPTSSIPLIVYEDHGEFAVTNAVDLPIYSDGIGGVTELFKNRIAVPFTGDYRDFRRVIHHELVHAMVNAFYFEGSIQSLISGGPRARIPIWFNEGLAEYAALGWDTQSDMYVREAVLEDHLAEIPDLGGYFAYRGGQSVWDYVAAQYGEEKIPDILHRVKTLRSVDDAFEKSIGLGTDELSDRWHRALREIHFPEVAAREHLADLGRMVVSGDDGYYNVSPALSPLGDRLVYVTTTQGLFDVYLADTDGTSEPVRLVAGQNSRDFESLPVLTPGLSWSPDGRRVAVAVRRGDVESIALIDVRTNMRRHIDLPGLAQILSLSWSPDGTRLALGASNGSQSDIYVLDLETLAMTNVTNDSYSDHEPTWRPDSQALVFHSDRGEHTILGTDVDMMAHDFDRKDLYFVAFDTPGMARRLTFNTVWDSYSARYGASDTELYFVSDANGIPNVHVMDPARRTSRPVTDLDVGVMQLAVSGDGRTMALVSLREGVPSIFVARDLAERRVDPPQPTVWAQRVEQDTTQRAPVAELANRTVRAQNPFLRDAADGRPYIRGRSRVRDSPGDTAATRERDQQQGPVRHPPDSLFGGVSVDFETLRMAGRLPVSDEVRALQEPTPDRAYTNDDGELVPRRYKLRFSPDIVYGAAGYDALYGVQGITQMMFSDMLGDHRILVSTNLLLDLRNSDYVISYEYLPGRVDWTFSTFHLSRLLADFERMNPTYYRYRQYGARLTASFPIDKFRRVDAEVGLVGVNQADITDVSRPTSARTVVVPRLTFTRDRTVPGYLFPIGGSRMAVSVSGSPFALGNSNVRFLTILGDARTYVSASRNRLVWAFRVSGAGSFGPQQQVFYTSGVQNWINRNFDDINGFPIADVSDFVFATPVMPVRGYDINAANGSHFGLLNAEFRFPLVASLLPGDLFLSTIQGQTFVDVGTVWGGRGTTQRDDILAGTGFGLRTIILGYPLRVDMAWPFDGTRFGDRSTYVSVGLDF